jgi:hypothetical protein
MSHSAPGEGQWSMSRVGAIVGMDEIGGGRWGDAMNRPKRLPPTVKPTRAVCSPLIARMKTKDAARIAEAEGAAAQRLEMLKLEHRTSRAELLWRLNGIYDVQKAALPLLMGLMVALTWAGAKADLEKYPKLPLAAGWVLIPIFSLLIRTKMKHHRQRNEELAMYHKLIEMAMWQKFPHTITETGQSRQGLSIAIGKDANDKDDLVTIYPEDLGWEHFIRKYRYVLPKLVKELKKSEDDEARTLRNDHPLPKPIASMSKIELNYMNFFVVCAIVISAVQIWYIAQSSDACGVVIGVVVEYIMNKAQEFWRLTG